MDKNIYKDLDRVLEYLNKKKLTHGDKRTPIEELWSNKDLDAEGNAVKLILKHLKDKKFIDVDEFSGINSIPENLNNLVFDLMTEVEIRIEGQMFIIEGGYCGGKALKDRLRRRDTYLFCITLCVCIATVISATYDSFQLVEEYQKHSLSWQRVAYFLTGAITILLAWLIKWLLDKTIGKK